MEIHRVGHTYAGIMTVGTVRDSGPNDIENGLTVFDGRTYRTYNFALIFGSVHLRWTDDAWTRVDDLRGLRFERIDDAYPEIVAWLNRNGEHVKEMISR